ncbi:hypothetical protein HanRHA438_Chr15g0685391 [Helianthus annuus]|nr:hypothetical protein HanRHA438_Chr15g0685391 [Helianthus annuus]
MGSILVSPFFFFFFGPHCPKILGPPLFTCEARARARKTNKLCFEAQARLGLDKARLVSSFFSSRSRVAREPLGSFAPLRIGLASLLGL